MLCYECAKAGRSQQAIGLCHHCSVALYMDHASMVADPVMASDPISKTVVLPKKARMLLCATCLAAWEQVHGVGAGRKPGNAPAVA